MEALRQQRQPLVSSLFFPNWEREGSGGLGPTSGLLGAIRSGEQCRAWASQGLSARPGPSSHKGWLHPLVHQARFRALVCNDQ